MLRVYGAERLISMNFLAPHYLEINKRGSKQNKAAKESQAITNLHKNAYSVYAACQKEGRFC
jgi:hypothetical protein